MRLQLSMLLLPITLRTNFCAAKFNSLVVLEQLNIPNDFVAPRSIARWNAPAVASKASSHVAGSKEPFLRTSGWSSLAAFLAFLAIGIDHSRTGACTDTRRPYAILAWARMSWL